jgi:hypothetical protein
MTIKSTPIITNSNNNAFKNQLQSKLNKDYKAGVSYSTNTNSNTNKNNVVISNVNSYLVDSEKLSSNLNNINNNNNNNISNINTNNSGNQKRLVKETREGRVDDILSNTNNNNNNNYSNINQNQIKLKPSVSPDTGNRNDKSILSDSAKTPKGNQEISAFKAKGGNNTNTNNNNNNLTPGKGTIRITGNQMIVKSQLIKKEGNNVNTNNNKSDKFDDTHSNNRTKKVTPNNSTILNSASHVTSTSKDNKVIRSENSKNHLSVQTPNHSNKALAMGAKKISSQNQVNKSVTIKHK